MATKLVFGFFNCTWASKLKQVFKDAISYEKEMIIDDYLKTNQFKSFNFANHYAIIRSVIDTTIKNSKNVFDALSCLANQKLSTAES
ncbi:MAG: hypothetical protein L3J54_08280 [Draconibacterium sp.]|nr:hypothetical protein [Draconibacterium sp.]